MQDAGWPLCLCVEMNMDDWTPIEQKEPAEARAMQYALKLLGYRQRSEREMCGRLERKGFATPVIDRTLAELTRLSLLDDREFARSWVASRTGRGTARITQELLQKGIDRDVAEESITSAMTAEDELASAWQVAVRATRARPLPPGQEALVRVRRLLQRRGFSYEVIRRVCARLNAQVSAEGDWLE